MISLSVLESTLRMTWSFCMTKPKNHSGQTSSKPCGTIPISCDVSYKKELTNYNIMKGICWLSPGMGST
jgi:hypothetical protein